MILGANELTNTDATRTNPITNESRLFDTFAPLNIAKVTINLDATNEYCEDALNNVIIQRKDGLQIAFDDWEIDDDDDDEYRAFVGFGAGMMPGPRRAGKGTYLAFPHATVQPHSRWFFGSGLLALPPGRGHQRDQSSSASRCTAGAAGFFILSQSGDLPER
jgi:hypothetical protein